MFYYHVKHRRGEKERTEMKEKRVNQGQFFFLSFVWIITLTITVVFMVAGETIIYLLYLLSPLRARWHIRHLAIIYLS